MKIILFGAGKKTINFLEGEESLKYDIQSVVDNDRNKQGTELCCGDRRLKVIAAEDIFKYDFSMILITIDNSEHQIDIMKQLIKLGVSYNEIKFLKNGQIIKRDIEEMPGKIIQGDNLSISICQIDGKEFFWCGDTNACDPLNECAKQGKLYIDGGLLSIAMLGKGTFLDIGANIGGVSLAFAACGWNGYSIEAADNNCRLLEKSIVLNDFDIKCINKGIWNNSVKLYFREYGPYGTVSTERTDNACEIEATSLDDLMRTELKCCSKINFIKMDIEGSEVEALAGAKEMLSFFDYPPIFVEANAWTLALVDNKTTIDLKCMAESYGYRVYRWDDNIWKKYSKKTFWDELCTDYILVHKNDTREWITISDEEYPVPSEVETVRRISDVLKKAVEDWGNKEIVGLQYQELVATACSLRDFPQIAKQKDISHLLEQLIDVSKSDVLLSKILRR